MRDRLNARWHLRGALRKRLRYRFRRLAIQATVDALRSGLEMPERDWQLERRLSGAQDA